MKHKHPDYQAALADARATICDLPAAIAVLAEKLGRPNNADAIATELETRGHKTALADARVSSLLQNTAQQIREALGKTNAALFHAQMLIAGLSAPGDAAEMILGAA